MKYDPGTGPGQALDIARATAEQSMPLETICLQEEAVLGERDLTSEMKRRVTNSEGIGLTKQAKPRESTVSGPKEWE